MNKDSVLLIGVDLGEEKDCQCATLNLYYNETKHIIYQTTDKEQVVVLNEIMEKVNKEKTALQLIKTKSKDNYNLALVVDSETYEKYCEQFKYFLNKYEEKGGAFEIWEEDRFSFEEYNLLREIFVYE